MESVLRTSSWGLRSVGIAWRHRAVSHGWGRAGVAGGRRWRPVRRGRARRRSEVVLRTGARCNGKHKMRN